MLGKTKQHLFEYKVNPYGTCDLVFSQLTVLDLSHLEEKDRYDYDDRYFSARSVIVHNVHQLTLDAIFASDDRNAVINEIQADIFDVVFGSAPAIYPVNTLLVSHNFSAIVHNVDDEDCAFPIGVTFKKYLTSSSQNAKMLKIIEDNDLILEQIFSLYIMAYYGCTNQDVILMITRVKRDRYVDDLEGFFERRLYAQELADEISENTKYYNEYYEENGEEHPDMIGDRTKF